MALLQLSNASLEICAKMLTYHKILICVTITYLKSPAACFLWSAFIMVSYSPKKKFNFKKGLLIGQASLVTESLTLGLQNVVLKYLATETEHCEKLPLYCKVPSIFVS